LITLNDIAKRHIEWIKIAKYLGANRDEVDDMVQTMYLKLGEIQIKEGSLNRFANYNGTINTIYLFKMLHNAFIDIKRAENKTIPHQDQFNPVESPEMAEMAHMDLMGEVKKAEIWSRIFRSKRIYKPCSCNPKAWQNMINELTQVYETYEKPL